MLNALLEDNLYYRKADKRVFIVKAQDDSLELRDPLSLSDAGTADASDYSRITTNNRLRKTLKGALASFDLSDPDATVRLAAVNEMLRSLDEDSIAILRARERSETNRSVQEAIRTGLAIADLFDAVFCIERTRFKPKPDVQGFLRLVRANHLRARRCIMVEDTLANLRTAKKLGMKTVWVSHERRAPRYVDLRIANLSELRRALPQLS